MTKSEKNLHHIAASYQEAIVDTLLDRISRISKEEDINQISLRVELQQIVDLEKKAQNYHQIITFQFIFHH